MTTDIKKFKKELESGDFVSAQKTLGNLIGSIPQVEADVLSLQYAHAYMKLMNVINEEYLDVLGRINDAGEDVNAASKELDETATILKKKKDLLQM